MRNRTLVYTHNTFSDNFLEFSSILKSWVFENLGFWKLVGLGKGRVRPRDWSKITVSRGKISVDGKPDRVRIVPGADLNPVLYIKDTDIWAVQDQFNQ